MSAIRTTAAIVAALALLALALFTYQGAQADREAACWAEATARNDWNAANMEAQITRYGSGKSDLDQSRYETLIWQFAEKSETLFAKCEALR